MANVHYHIQRAPHHTIFDNKSNDFALFKSHSSLVLFHSSNLTMKRFFGFEVDFEVTKMM